MRAALRRNPHDERTGVGVAFDGSDFPELVTVELERFGPLEFDEQAGAATWVSE